MEEHPDHKAREEMHKSVISWNSSYQIIPEAITSLPSNIKPYAGPRLRVKKLDPEAIIPTKANRTDAGYDLYALKDVEIPAINHKLIKTGISMAIPEGYVGLIWPRSGLAYKNGLDVFAGVIDSGYRGDVGVILYNSRVTSHYQVKKGDRIAQILFQKVKSFDLVEVDNLDDSARGRGGFGSTGS
jgi:dUTP pyrophosphatase